MSEEDGSKRTMPMTERKLREVTIGELSPLNDVIRLVPSDPEWKLIFATEAKRIRHTLGSAVLLLEHVGSTAVPGLSAKPVIDMVMTVENSAAEASYVPALEAIGYALRIREADWYEHRMLTSSAISGNLHVFSDGCEEIDRMLFFRNWLRNHPEDRNAYENTKRALASRTWKFVQDYADAKTEIVQEILARASQD